MRKKAVDAAPFQKKTEVEGKKEVERILQQKKELRERQSDGDL